jgi:hypothetical protein
MITKKKIEAVDILVIVVTIGCMILMAKKIDGVVTNLFTSVVTFYLTKKIT